MDLRNTFTRRQWFQTVAAAAAVSSASADTPNIRRLTDGWEHYRGALAGLCDNSRNLEMMPSDLSDFARYGGLYYPVHLVYVPAVSVERVHVESKLEGAKATAAVKLRFYNPSKAANPPVEFRITDPAGKPI